MSSFKWNDCPNSVEYAEVLPCRVFDQLLMLQKEVEGLIDTREALLLTDRILTILEADLEKDIQEDASQKDRKDEEDPSDTISERSEGQSSEPESPEVEESLESDDSSQEELSSIQGSSLAQILSASESDLHGDLFEAIREGLSLAKEQSSALTLPVADEPPMDPVQGRLLLEKSLRESGKLRASLQGLVQSSRLSKPVTRRSGNRMDSKGLCRLGMGDARVFLRMDAHKAPNTAVHILIDRSPSMSALVATEGRPVGRRIDLAWEATLSLAIALEGIQGVNVGITAFPGKDGDGSSVYEILPHGTSIRSRIGAYGGDLDGSTPLAEALWYAGAQLVQQREERKLLLVLTDGIPDDLDAALNILFRFRPSNIEVTGIGLGIEVDRVFDSALSVQLISELSIRMNEVCKKLLLAA